jgi:uncharacterized protein
VTFAADAPWSLLDLVTIREHLRQILGRDVHLVERAGLRNPFRRQAILSHREVIFAAKDRRESRATFDSMLI